jgi:hypothetical protein
MRESAVTHQGKRLLPTDSTTRLDRTGQQDELFSLHQLEYDAAASRGQGMVGCGSNRSSQDSGGAGAAKSASSELDFLREFSYVSSSTPQAARQPQSAAPQPTSMVRRSPARGLVEGASEATAQARLRVGSTRAPSHPAGHARGGGGGVYSEWYTGGGGLLRRAHAGSSTGLTRVAGIIAAEQGRARLSQLPNEKLKPAVRLTGTKCKVRVSCFFRATRARACSSRSQAPTNAKAADAVGLEEEPGNGRGKVMISMIPMPTTREPPAPTSAAAPDLSPFAQTSVSKKPRALRSRFFATGGGDRVEGAESEGGGGGGGE